MEEKKVIKMSLSTFCLLLAIVVIFIMGYVIFTMRSEEVNSDIKDTSLNTKIENIDSKLEENINKEEKETDNNEVSETELTRIAQGVYNKAFNIIAEGAGITKSETKITVGSDNTVGGKITVSAYEVDFSKIEKYFTKQAIDYIKAKFTDTSKDDKYYIFAEKCIYSDETKNEFIWTIFSQTDSGERKLKVKIYDENMIVAVSEKSSFFELDEYIIFKKVDNEWKIDMFQ